MIVPEAVIPVYLRATHANAAFITAEGAHQAVAEKGVRPEPYGPPKRLRSDVRIAAGRVGSAPVYTVTPATGRPTGHVLYVHGGGWIQEAAPEHWALSAQIAVEANTTVTVPIYALLPHGTAQLAHDLVLTIALRLIEEAGPFHLAGDSAGGQIALSVAQTLRDRGVPSVPTILVSPALDLSFSNPRIPDVQPHDPWLGRDGTRVLGKLWAGTLEVDNPIVSPLRGRFDDLGPMLVFTGTHDVFNPDTRLLIDKARAAGVQVTVRERAKALHVFPLLPTRVGRAARAEIVATIRR